MRKVLTISTMVSLILLMVTGSFAQSGDAVVSGRVTDMRTGEPLVKAFVMADMLDGRYLVARTDSSGFYQMDKLSTGMYEFSAFAFGYYLEVYPETLEVVTGEIITDIDFALYTKPTGAISGWVTDSVTGAPIVNAKIFVHQIQGCEKSLTYTDSLGYYYIEKLEEGFYRATAFARRIASTPGKVTCDPIRTTINRAAVKKILVRSS